MLKFITEYFGIFFIAGVLAGLFLPFSSILTPYILYMMMFVLFLSSLRMDISEIFSKIRDLKLVIYLVLLILVVVPAFVYFILRGFLEPEYSLAILVLLVMPAGVAVPVYSTIFKGDKELALIISAVTSLLCPLTIPFLIYYLAGVQTNINFLQLFATLGMVIFVPFVLSTLVRKIRESFIAKTEGYYSPVSILIVALIIAGGVAKVDVTQFVSSGYSVIYSFLLLFVLAILLHIIGYYIAYKKGNEIRITASLATAYMNSSLAIIIAAEFFGAKTLLMVALYQIPANLVLIAFGYIVRRYLHSSINA